jgi:hypothetical protein
MPEWSETLYIIIPVSLRDEFAVLASRIMPDVGEDKMFDSIRLSLTGKEPAIALMSECPCNKELAKAWAFVMGYGTPDDYPDLSGQAVTALNKYRANAELAKLNSRFFMAITERLDGRKVKEGLKAIRVLDSKFAGVTHIRDIDDVLTRRGLVRITPSD